MGSLPKCCGWLGPLRVPVPSAIVPMPGDSSSLGHDVLGRWRRGASGLFFSWGGNISSGCTRGLWPSEGHHHPAPTDMEGGPRGLLHLPGTWHVHAGAWQPARLCLLSPNDLEGTRGHRGDRPHTQKFCCWLQNQPQKRGWRRGGRHECSKMGWGNCPVQPCPVLPWTPKRGCPRTGVSPRSRAPPAPWKGLPPTIDRFLVTFQFSEPLGQRTGAVPVAVPAGTLRVSR